MSTLPVLPDAGFVDVPTACSGFLTATANALGHSPRLLTDLCLGSFARAGLLRVVTFDRDFERLGQCKVLPLAPPAH